jgi:hypothetical protein
MLETPHVIVGAAIATKVVSPALAIPLALASHFVLEKVPHWNPHLNTEKKKFGKVTPRSTKIVLVDIVASTAAALFLASRALPDSGHALTILACGFVAALPDIIEGPYFFLNSKSKFIEKWVAFQKSLQVDVSLLPGLATQALTIIAAFLWVTS